MGIISNIDLACTSAQPLLFSTLFNYTGLFYKEISPNNYFILEDATSVMSGINPIVETV